MVALNQQRLDSLYMRRALELAEEAAAAGEIPVGAVVVLSDSIIGEGRNRCVEDKDPSGHAEILALKAAAKSVGSFRVDGATLYVSLEPCLMCCGAVLQSRVSRLVFGAREPRTGAVVSIHDSLRVAGVEPHVAVTEGVLADESTNMLKQFFQELR